MHLHIVKITESYIVACLDGSARIISKEGSYSVTRWGLFEWKTLADVLMYTTDLTFIEAYGFPLCFDYSGWPKQWTRIICGDTS